MLLIIKDIRATNGNVVENKGGYLKRWLQVPVMLLLALGNLPVPGLSWGERGHKLINAAAVEILPEPLRSYFLARQVYWVEHAIDPDLLAHDDASERPHLLD